MGKVAQNIVPIKMFDGVQDAALVHVPGMVALGLQALRENPAPRQRIDTEKLTNIARECVVDEWSYAKVSVKDGEVVASLCALTGEQLFYQRKQSTVVQYYTTEPGEGIKLMRDYLRWARDQRKIKAIVFMVEFGSDYRIEKLLRRLGLRCESPVYVEWK